MSTEQNLFESSSSSAAVDTKRLPDKKVSLRFKHSEWIIIAGDIATAAVSINAYFRQLALEAPVPRKAHSRVRGREAGENAKIYAKFLGEINKIGSNINQLTRQANTAVKLEDAGLMPHDDAFLEALITFGEMADELRRVLKQHAAASPQCDASTALLEKHDDH